MNDGMRLVRLRLKEGPQSPLKIRKRKAFADGGTVPAFDPDKPFEAVSSAPAFDPSKPFESAGPAPKKPNDESMWSIGKQALLGVPRGLLDIAGALGEAVTARPGREMMAASKAADAVAPQGVNQHPEGPTDSDLRRQAYNQAQTPGYGETMRHAAGLEGANAPQTPAERIASGFGEGASGAVLSGPSGLMANMLIGGIGGATGRTAAEFTPEPYKPVAEIAGNLAGGLGASAVASGARGGLGVASRLAQPLTRDGQQTLAGRYLEARASDPAALRTALENPSPEIVAGSKPTTFQQTGDMGIGALEREVATKNPAEFMQRRAEQNAARLDELADLQSPGNPIEVANALRGRISAIDKMTQDAVEDAMNVARDRASQIGGRGAPESYGESIRGNIQPRVDALGRDVSQAVNDLGGHATPEAYGNSLRTSLQDAENAARRNERTLWNAVDPDGSLTVGMQPVQQAAKTVYGNLTTAAEASLKPAEQKIINIMAQYPAVVPFKELTDLRSLVSADLREELTSAGRTTTYARLSQLRGAIEDAIDGNVQNRIASEAAAVKAGALQPEDTVIARLQREANEFRSARESARSSAAANAAEREAPFSATPRTEVSGRPANPAGDQGVSSPAEPTINFDQSAAERLAAASEATRNRAQTFNSPGLKPILRKEGQQGPYRLADSGVPERIFAKGPGGYDAVSRYLGAATSPDARRALEDYAVSTMRRAAVRPDGTINPQAFQKWRQAHQDALRAFPELDQRLANVSRASELLEVERANSLAGVQNSAIPSQFFKPGPQGFESVQRLRNIVGDDRAMPILEDYAASTLRKSAMTPEGLIDPDKFVRWQAQHSDALRAFPELKNRLSDAAQASSVVSDMTALRRSALQSAQEGAFGKIAGLTDSQDVTRAVGQLFTGPSSVSEVRKLVAQVKSDPQAMEGLRKATVDHMVRKLVSNTEAGTSGRPVIKSDQFQTFFKNNEQALSQILSPAQMNSARAIAADLQRANRSVASVKLPGGSNTAQDLTGIKHGQSMLAKILIDAAATAGGWLTTMSPTLGLMSGAGAHMANAMRSSGFAKVDDLIKQAMLDPALAKQLLAKAPDKITPAADRMFARRLTFLTAAALAKENQDIQRLDNRK